MAGRQIETDNRQVFLQDTAFKCIPVVVTGDTFITYHLTTIFEHHDSISLGHIKLNPVMCRDIERKYLRIHFC